MKIVVNPENPLSFFRPPRRVSQLAKELQEIANVESEKQRFAAAQYAVTERLRLLTIVGDALVIAAAIVFSYWLRIKIGRGDPGPWLSEALQRGYVECMIGGGFALMLILAHFNVYNPSKVLHYRQVSFLIIKSCTLWLIGVLSLSGIVGFYPPFPRSSIALSAVSSSFGLLVWRFFLARMSSRESISKYLRERILFVGWNELSERLVRFVVSDPNNAHALVGCVPSINGAYEKQPPDDIPHLADYRDLPNMLRTRFIDIVILADCTASMKEIDGLATLCEKELVKFKVIPSYFQILTTGLALQTISGIPILGISQLPLQRPANQIVKRTVDIVGSIAGLILSAPLIAIFGAIVYLESPGPIFYRQTRLGRGGVPFEIIKIRSMRLDAEKAGKPGWTVKDDPRRLRIGAFIRSWNIDELPQFWNVLQGDMSLVGPRPERPELIASFKEEIIHYQARHSGKPGLTGWAAINGLRGDTDLTERIRCDIYYLENWSLWLDFQIMFLTFFRRKNAG